MRIGEYQELRADRESPNGMYLADLDGEVLLPRGQIPAGFKLGQSLRVFVLTDSEDRPIATTKTPRATVGEFAKLQVVSVTAAGAFLDWGIDKDLFCPHAEQATRMQEGFNYLVRVYLDERSHRVVCTSKIARFLTSDGEGLTPGQPVKIIVLAKTATLISVAVENRIRGSIFPDEWHEQLIVGDLRDAFVKSVRSEDHKVAISLRPQGRAAVLGQREKLLDALNRNGGSLKVSDQSTPEEIQRRFGMSKGTFKKLIGALYKEGVIRIESDKIRQIK